MAKYQEANWHSLSSEESLHRLESDEQKGLSSKEAFQRKETLGANTMPAKPGPSALMRFLQQFQNPLIYVLLVAGAVMLYLPGHLVDAAVIFGVVLVNSVVGYVQETQAKEAIEALSKLVKIESTVIRDGKAHRLNAAELVPGDIVVLQSGDRVPADIRLIKVRELSINESMLTGESLPVSKEIPVVPEDAALADRTNMGYSGTLVTFGQGTGLVVSTGGDTEIGRISVLIEEAEKLATPLTRKLAQFSLYLTWVILGLAVLTVAAGSMHGIPLVDSFTAAVALAVAAIPEGLPAAMTVILAIGVTRMAGKNAVVRKLPAVETLGSTSIICTDKTGTLTKNEMTVTAIQGGERCYEVTGTGYRPEGDVLWEQNPVEQNHSPALLGILQAGVLCNTSQAVELNGEWSIEGDPTEGALLISAVKAGLNPWELREKATWIESIPFESERQYMATLHVLPDEGRIIYVKGATERVLGLCDTALDGQGNIVSLDHQQASRTSEELASRGLRVLAFAQKKARPHQMELEHRDIEKGMTFLGFQGMIDPPRPEAIASVKACQNAGITVKMITGDHSLTAQSIAHKMGIGNSNSKVITGAELAKTSDQELEDVAFNTDIFARVAPEQKLKLVKALQNRKAIVAMTGDGVNDAPALKQADIGIAMGITGTEVAKDSADMILTDDNFASIEAAVEEGRGVYENLRKFIIWTLPTNGGEALLVIVSISAGLILPLLPLHLLWINMTTAAILGITLAFEPKEQGLMQRPARDPAEPILTKDLMTRIIYVSVLMVIAAFLLFTWEMKQGIGLAGARTIVANVIVLVETVYLFNCRSLYRPVWKIGIGSNRWVIFGALFMIGLQLMFVYAPFMQSLFGTAPVPLSTWLDVTIAALVIFGIVEIEKRARFHP